MLMHFELAEMSFRLIFIGAKRSVVAKYPVMKPQSNVDGYTAPIGTLQCSNDDHNDDYYFYPR